MTKSKEVIDREFRKNFDNLVSKVFGENIIMKPSFEWSNSELADYGFFNGWEIYKKDKKPLLFNWLNYISKTLVSKIETNTSTDVAAKNLQEPLIPIIKYESVINQCRPKSVVLYEQSLISKVKEFIREYELQFGQRISIKYNN